MIIGFAGYARSGKHECAKALEPLGFKTVAFADKLRTMLYILNPIVHQDMMLTVRVQDVIDKYGWDGYKNTKYHSEIRRLIQTLGTDCGRNLLGNTVWIDATLNFGLDQDVAVADVRFPNEAWAIKERGGYVVCVLKPGVGPANEHESEKALDEWDFDAAVFNGGTVEELHETVQALIVELALKNF